MHGRRGPPRPGGHAARREGSSSVAAHVMNRSCVSAPICTSATWVNPGRGELADSGDVPPGVWAARHPRAHVILAHHRGCRVERGRDWQLGVHSPAASEPAELIHRPQAAGRPRYRDADRRGSVRQVPDLRGLDIEVPAAVGHRAARPQRPDDLDGLAEHLVPHRGEGPLPADNVLVQILARPEADGEPAARAAAWSPPSARPRPGDNGGSGRWRRSSAECGRSPGRPRRARSRRTASGPGPPATGSSGR